MNNLIHKMNNNLFGKGKEKILECFYNNKYRELYFSEVLRETNLTQNTTLKHLISLKINNILISTKKIANTFYKLNKNNLQAIALLSYFDYKRFNELDSTRKRAIMEFLDGLRIKPLIVLVFGSTAKKSYNNKSDIDLMLVFNEKEREDKKLREEIEAVTGLRIQTFIIDYKYFKEQLLKKEDNVLMHAVKTGFILIGHHLFYKEVL